MFHVIEDAEVVRVSQDDGCGESFGDDRTTADTRQLSGSGTREKPQLDIGVQTPGDRGVAAGSGEDLIDHESNSVAVGRQVGYFRWSGDTGRCFRQHDVIWLFQAVLHQQMMEVPLVEDLAPHVRIQIAESPHLAVLLGDEFLVHRRDLDEEVIVREIEVGPELLNRRPRRIPLDHERTWLVLPRHRVEVEKARELSFTGVGEVDLVGRLSEEVVGQ